MQKVMLFLASMLIVFSLSSCSKDDDSTITISPKEVTMKVDENQRAVFELNFEKGDAKHGRTKGKKD